MVKIYSGASTSTGGETCVYLGREIQIFGDVYPSRVECLYCGKISKSTKYNCEFCGAPLSET